MATPVHLKKKMLYINTRLPSDMYNFFITAHVMVAMRGTEK